MLGIRFLTRKRKPEEGPLFGKPSPCREIIRQWFLITRIFRFYNFASFQHAYEVKWALESITMNKASEGDGILVELFQILKANAVKVLHSICQKIWKTQQWPQDWKRSVFIPIPKKSNPKECSNYHIIVLISQASKIMLKILQIRLQQ